jgi:hypothetical protein
VCECFTVVGCSLLARSLIQKLRTEQHCHSIVVSCLSHPRPYMDLTNRTRGTGSRAAAQPDVFNMPALLSILGFMSLKSMICGAASASGPGTGPSQGTNRARSKQGNRWARRSDSIDLHRTRLQAPDRSQKSEDAFNVPSAAALLTVSPGPDCEILKDRPLKPGQQ